MVVLGFCNNIRGMNNLGLNCIHIGVSCIYRYRKIDTADIKVYCNAIISPLGKSEIHCSTAQREGQIKGQLQSKKFLLIFFQFFSTHPAWPMKLCLATAECDSSGVCLPNHMSHIGSCSLFFRDISH